MPGSKPCRRPNWRRGDLDEGPTRRSSCTGAGRRLPHRADRRPRWHQHWGATDEEIARPLPDDDLIADSKLDSTQAITIHAPVERIWPWLAQAGYGGRAGFYSYDLLERRFGARNTNRLNPDLPTLTTGDRVPFYPGMPMTVAVADPPHALVLWLVTTANKAIDPTGPWVERQLAGGALRR
jgi:hypothetical protein